MSADVETNAEKQDGDSGSNPGKPRSETVATRIDDFTVSRRGRAWTNLLDRAKRLLGNVPLWSPFVRRCLKTIVHFPRTRPWLTGTLVLSVILAAMVGNYSLGPADEQQNDANQNSLDLDDVEIYPPESPPAAVKQPGQLPLSAATLPQTRSVNPDGGVARLEISPMKKSAYAGGPQLSPVFPRVPDRSNGPRRVWLTGTIEDFSTQPSAIKRISHVELPASRRSGNRR